MERDGEVNELRRRHRGRGLDVAKLSAPLLGEALREFADRNINLTKLESRPRRNRPWQYVFYLDFDGHWEDVNCRDALVSLLNRAAFVKLLGSYPPAARMDEETVNAQATLLQI